MFTQAFDYKRWADERSLHAIRFIDNNLHPNSYRFVLQQINHMIIVEELFRSRLTNNPAPHRNTNTESVPKLTALSKRLKASNDWYSNYVAELENGDEEIVFKFVDGASGMMTRCEILFHIVNHGSYHRGNIAHELDLASVPHPIDGYGAYIHEKEPERRETT